MLWLQVKRQRCCSPLNRTASCLDPNSGIGKLFRCQLLIYRLSTLMRCLVSEILCPLFAGGTLSFSVPTTTDLAALPLPLWCRVQSLLFVPRGMGIHSIGFSTTKSKSAVDGFNNIQNKQCWDHYPKADGKADKTICLNWLRADTQLYYSLHTCCQLGEPSISQYSR